MSYLQLSLYFNQGVRVYVIRGALCRAGFKRYIARSKPPLSKKNRTDRLNWAHEHQYQSKDQWWKILQTDETQVTPGRYYKTWVTRRKDEEIDETCLINKVRKKKGWMFQGCFNSTIKGPGIFQEKDWGWINQESYYAHIIPVIYSWIRMNPGLQLMQDGALGHLDSDIQQDLRERGVKIIFQPAFSPDLNPIETMQNWMKDYIEARYSEEDCTYNQLRQAVKKAWDSITVKQLRELIESIHERCKDVIKAEGGHTKQQIENLKQRWWR